MTASQLGASLALSQLLTEGPHLWPCTWNINPVNSRLAGRLTSGAAMEHLHEYAEMLGGSVRPGPDESFHGLIMRPHTLTARWREAVVQVVLIIPAPNQIEE